MFKEKQSLFVCLFSVFYTTVMDFSQNEIAGSCHPLLLLKDILV